jgi:hypothetical protein
MFHAATFRLQPTLHGSAACALWAASLLLLITTLVLSGPWTCIIHNQLVDAAHHRQGHTHHHHVIACKDTTHADCTIDQLVAHVPSNILAVAFTIAILPSLILVPRLLAIAFQLLKRDQILYSLPIAPPWHPPRASGSFTF